MEWTEYLRFLLALAFVLGLIGLAAWLLRRTGVAGPALPRRSGTSSRLAVEDTLVIDARRRLLLVRCDDREHLVLLGPERDCVLETGMAVNPIRSPQQEAPQLRDCWRSSPTCFARLSSAAVSTSSPDNRSGSVWDRSVLKILTVSSKRTITYS